ncbi:MAG: methyltransferase domain-containing protein [Terrimicrobiaceae bacterium]
MKEDGCASSVTQSSIASKELSDTWKRGDPYDQYIGRWSRRVAPLFLSWLGVPDGLRWLDVGCGTGALCASILDQCSPISVAGVDPSEGFLEKSKERFADRVVLHRGSAAGIPLADRTVDATVSGLVLNFVPDGCAALAEMARVTVRGGTVGAYVWDYAEGMELIRLFWDAAVELDPEAAMLDEGARLPLCRPEPLAELFASAGAQSLVNTAIVPYFRKADYAGGLESGLDQLMREARAFVVAPADVQRSK